MNKVISLNEIRKDVDLKTTETSLGSKSLQIHKIFVEEKKEENKFYTKEISVEKKEERNNKVIRSRDVDKVWDIYMNNGWIDGKVYTPGPFGGINNCWKNKPCFVIGSGPDLKVFIDQVGFQFLEGKHSIGINHVIETWDRFEWFLFLDRRFLKKTTYDLYKFKGKIFAQNNTGISADLKNVVRFQCGTKKPTIDIKDGLYSNKFSGLAALNLAIIAGANPIFLIGFGMGKDGNKNLFHFRTKYQGVGTQPKEQYGKYLKVYNNFRHFKKWHPAIIHVTEGQSLVDFKKINFQTLKRKFNISKRFEKNVNVNKNIAPRIVHLSFSNNVNVHADITRAIIDKCYGNHYLYTFNDIPNADLYITEHFISTRRFIDNFPYRHKTINIIHSMNCFPIGNWKCNVALTHAWKTLLSKRGVQNIRVIYGGINLKPYKNVNRNKGRKIFGRITRWSPGKIPDWWNGMITEILDANENVSCLMFIDNRNRARKLLNHKRMIYDYSCKINDFKGNWLKKLNIYVHANGYFRETMSFAAIEAMATGLPIIYLKEPALREVVGDNGICVNNKQELKTTILNLLYDNDICEKYSQLSKERSKFFDIKKTIKKFDELIKEMV